MEYNCKSNRIRTGETAGNMRRMRQDNYKRLWNQTCSNDQTECEIHQTSEKTDYKENQSYNGKR
jgi:hypothetical protein